MFHVSLLQKAEINITHILSQVPLKDKKDLILEVRPVRILDQGEKNLEVKRFIWWRYYGAAPKLKKKLKKGNRKWEKVSLIIFGHKHEV